MHGIIARMTPHLNSEQRKAVEYGNGPLLVIAGAGSGKTRTLTSRLQHLVASGIPGSSILAITFTNKAAEEMARRVGVERSVKTPGGEVPFIGTFHSFGAFLLREEGRALARTNHFSIFDADDSLSLVKHILRELDIPKERINPVHALSQIERLKDELLEIDDIERKEIRIVFERYEEALKKSNAFDFGDLIQKPVILFKRQPEILKKYRGRFRYILVDEFQDINTSQYALISLLAHEHRNLNVVGDDAQSIYGFRGSDFRNFLNFDRDWNDARVIKLEQNYRSTKTIIAAASKLIERNSLQKKKDLWTDNPEGNPVRIVVAPSEDEQADWISRELRGLSSRAVGESLAILYRTNAQSRVLEEALLSARLPYRIFGGIRFYDRQEIKDLIAGLRLAVNPSDRASALRLGKNLPKRTSELLFEELPAFGNKLTPVELITFFIEKSGYLELIERKFKNAADRLENIKELIRFAGQFESTSQFLERIALVQSTDEPAKRLLSLEGKTVVNLMTIHLAKGLEFDHVFVSGVSEGLLPHERSLRLPEELEEERRLLYVAMTRASKTLTLTFTHIPSRFLYEIPPELTEFINLKGGGDADELPDEEEVYID